MRMPITFVTFYMDVSQRTMDSIHATTSTITVTEPHEYISAMFASARHFHSDCRCLVLSDEKDALPAKRPHQPHPLPAGSIAPHALALDGPGWNTCASPTAMSSSWTAISSSMAIWPHVFTESFAVALTYRAGDSKWPINAGLNFAHGRHLKQAARFHQIWLDEFQARYGDRSVWGGDQDTLRELFSGRRLRAR